MVRLVPDRPLADAVAVAAADRGRERLELLRARPRDVVALASPSPSAGTGPVSVSWTAMPRAAAPRNSASSRSHAPAGYAPGSVASKARAPLRPRRRREVLPVDEHAHAVDAEVADLLQRAVARARGRAARAAPRRSCSGCWRPTPSRGARAARRAAVVRDRRRSMRGDPCNSAGRHKVRPSRLAIRVSRSVTAIVDTPEEAAALELPPLLVRRPLEAYLDAHGLGSGPIEAEPRRRGPLQRHLPDPPRRRRAGAAAPAAPAAPALGARRAARGAPAGRRRGRRRAHPEGAGRLRRRVGDRRAVLRHGARDRRRDRDRAARRVRQPRRTAAASPRSSSTRWWRSTPSTGRPAASATTASRPATSTASCAASAGCGSTTRRASCRCSTTSRAWLAEHKPESGPATIVHGDYRLGNVMFAPARRRG